MLFMIDLSSIDKLLVVSFPFLYYVFNVFTVVSKGRVNLSVGWVLEFHVFDFSFIQFHVRLNCQSSWSFVLYNDISVF